MPTVKFVCPSPETTFSITRGIAAFLSGFTLLNLAGETLAPYFAGNFWWIDLRPLPVPRARMLLFISAALMVAFALRPTGAIWRRYLTAAAVGVLGLFATWNAIEFFALLARGSIHSGFPVPLSLCIIVGMILIFRCAVRPFEVPPKAPNGEQINQRRIVVAVALACCVGFPLAQMVCFGQTDYRRHADAIVVFGARTYADGTASQALADRVQTGCELYRQGLAARIIFSGGPGDGPVHETQTMRRLALKAGVPDSAIYCDRQGTNTEATVRNTGRLFGQLGVRRVLAVSHAYHLPRVKMAYLNAGWNVYTVPARETRTLSKMPLLTIREVAAIWAYYFRPFAASPR